MTVYENAEFTVPRDRFNIASAALPAFLTEGDIAIAKAHDDIAARIAEGAGE